MSDTNTITREISFWWNEATGEIHLSDGNRFIAAAAPEQMTSLNGHRVLFEWLRSQLEADGKPAPKQQTHGFQTYVNNELPPPPKRRA